MELKINRRFNEKDLPDVQTIRDEAQIGVQKERRQLGQRLYVQVVGFGGGGDAAGSGTPRRRSSGTWTPDSCPSGQRASAGS